MCERFGPAVIMRTIHPSARLRHPERMRAIDGLSVVIGAGPLVVDVPAKLARARVAFRAGQGCRLMPLDDAHYQQQISNR